MNILSPDTLGDAVKALLGGKHYGGRWWPDGSDSHDWLKLEIHQQKVGIVGDILRFPNAFASAMARAQAKAHFPGYLRKLSFVRVPGDDRADQHREGVYRVLDRGGNGAHYEMWRIRRATEG